MKKFEGQNFRKILAYLKMVFLKYKYKIYVYIIEQKSYLRVICICNIEEEGTICRRRRVHAYCIRSSTHITVTHITLMVLLLPNMKFAPLLIWKNRLIIFLTSYDDLIFDNFHWKRGNISINSMLKLFENSHSININYDQLLRIWGTQCNNTTQRWVRIKYSFDRSIC